MKEKIKFLMEKGYFLDPEIIDYLDESTFNLIDKYLEPKEGIVLNKNIINELKTKYLVKSKIIPKTENIIDDDVKIIKNYEDSMKKIEVADFVDHYKLRYNFLSKVLQSRLELSDVISINRTFSKMVRDRVSLIGMVYDKQITKNGNIILEIEDLSGSMKILINNNKKEMFEKAKNIVMDEIIGIVGNMGTKIVFANELFFPEITLNGSEMKKSNNEDHIAFISDIHIGSKMFLEKEFLKFIKWLNGESGSSEQKKIAKSVKYLMIAGDIIDGIGIYPGQDEELNILDIKGQYDKCAELLSKIRKDIKIIISPGNHDATRLAEPQPIFDETLAEGLHQIPNITLITNPGVVNVGSYEGFSGFEVLIYHGFSFDYYIDQIESIRFGGGYDRGDLVMKFLLQKRHLAPSHTSTLFVVDPKKDDLIIDNIPDFFISGHLHKSSVSHYGKTTMISGSCWQSRTAFQDKVGHHPEPCRVPVVNLKTRDVKLMKFCE
jgi:DNA polymerase II small subunit